jgi:hypothetical protein
MPPSTLARRILAGEDPLDDLIARLATKSAPPLEAYEARTNPGLLSRIGEVLDAPGRAVREALTGRPGATGRDVLGLGRNAPGLDTGDVAGFLAEVALDPLNLIGGFGTLTKAGRQAARAGTLARDLKAARELAASVRRPAKAGLAGLQESRRALIQKALGSRKALRDVTEELAREGAETRLLPTWRAQAEARVPQRALLTVGLPFTEGTPIVRGARALGGLQWAGQKLAASPPGRMTRRLFDPGLVRSAEGGGEMLERSPDVAPYIELTRGAQEGAAQEALKAQADLQAEIARRSARGEDVTAWQQALARARESIGVPGRAGKEAARIIATGRQKGLDLEERYLARRAAAHKRSAIEALKTADARGKRYETAAEELEKVATLADARARGLIAKGAETLASGRDVAREILGTPLTPARAARILRKQRGVWSDMEKWAAEVEGRIEKAMKRRGVLDLRAKTAVGPEALAHLGQKARVEQRISRLADFIRRLNERGLRGMEREAEEGIAEFHRVMGDKAERTFARAKNRSEVLNRGAGELLRLKLERRVQKLRERAARSRDLGLERWRELAAQATSPTLAPKESLRLFERQTELMQRAYAEAGSLQRAGQAAKAVLKGVDKQTRELAEQLSGVLERGVQEEIALWARPATSYLKRPTVSYMERVLTPEAREWLRKSGKESDFGRHLEARGFRILGGDMEHRSQELLDVYTDAANEWFAQNRAGFEGDWFQLDPSKSFPVRYLSGRQRIEMAKLAHGIVEGFATGTPHVQGQTMALEDFLQRMPLYRLRGQSLSSSPEALKEQLRSMGLGGRGIPLNVASEVLEAQAKITAPEEIQKMLGVFDDLTKMWKVSVTLPFPGHHAKNLFGNTILQWLGGGADPRLMWEAFRRTVIALMRGDSSWLRQAERLGILRGSQAMELLETSGVREAHQAPITGALFKRFPRLERVAEKSKALTSLVENFSRTWHYLSREAAGDTPMEAARSTRKWLLDYSELTPTERLVMRRMIPFYSWTRKSLPRIFESFVSSPRKAALAIRGTTQPTADRGGPVPEFLRQTGAIPAGLDAQGAQRFVYGFGSPYEEINKLDLTSPEGGVLGGARKAMRALGGQLNPMLKMPAELAGGREFFFDREILHGDRAEPILGQIPGVREALDVRKEEGPGGARYRGDPYLLWLLRNSPLGRLVRDTGALTNAATGIDPRGNRLSDLTGALFGVRSTTVSETDRVRTMQEINRRLATRLIREGKLGQVPTQFATGEGKTDEETLALLKEQARLRKELNRLRGDDEDEVLDRALKRALSR